VRPYSPLRRPGGHDPNYPGLLGLTERMRFFEDRAQPARPPHKTYVT